jgi:hypothetical protein
MFTDEPGQETGAPVTHFLQTFDLRLTTGSRSDYKN